MSNEAAMLPYGRQLIEDDDIAAVAEVLRSGFLTTGPYVARFENALAGVVGSEHAVVCNNGTAALHMAADALQLGPGDIVIVPSLTFLASANGPHFTGADIHFADVDPATGLLTPATLRQAIERAGSRAKAVVVVHLNGQCPDMEQIAAIARQAGLAVIEDACHALGSVYRGSDGGRHRIGSCSHSDLACFSFHPVKTIAMGEGGAVTTADAALADRLRLFRSHGMIRDAGRFQCREQAFDEQGRPNPWYYEMPRPGYNYRESDLNCALGISQLRKIDRFSSRRRAIAARYDAAFAAFPDWAKPVPHMSWCDPVLHLYVMAIDFARTPAGSRGALMRALQARGIGTQVHYLPVHRQPYYAAMPGSRALPGADTYYDRALSIPYYPAMTDADVERTISTLAEVLGIR